MNPEYTIDNHIDNHIETDIDNLINHAISGMEIEAGQEIINNTKLDTSNIPTTPNIPTTQNTSNIPTTQNTQDSNNMLNIEVFNSAMHQYLRMDEEIKSLMEAVKHRNQIKKQLGETISHFLRSNNIEKVDLDGSYKGKRLESIVKDVPRGFTKESVVSAIHDELQDDDELFDKIMMALQRVSVMKEVWKLKITEEKKPKNTYKKNKLSAIDIASNLINQED